MSINVLSWEALSCFCTWMPNVTQPHQHSPLHWWISWWSSHSQVRSTVISSWEENSYKRGGKKPLPGIFLWNLHSQVIPECQIVAMAMPENPQDLLQGTTMRASVLGASMHCHWDSCCWMCKCRDDGAFRYLWEPYLCIHLQKNYAPAGKLVLRV